MSSSQTLKSLPYNGYLFKYQLKVLGVITDLPYLLETAINIVAVRHAICKYYLLTEVTRLSFYYAF